MTSFNMDGFGNYTDTTNVALKDITTGDSFKSFKGNSFSGQTGNSVSNQTGNKDAWQHGYSNSVIVGMSFSTSLAATFSTTVGMSVSTTAGLAIGTNVLGKVALFLGLEASVNSSAAVKVTHGGTYTFDYVAKWKTAAQETQSVTDANLIAANVRSVIGTEIATYAAGVTVVAAGAVTETIGSRDITCATSYTLTSPTVTLNGPTSLTATTAGDLTLNSGRLRMLGGTASMNFFGLIKIG